MSVRLLPKSEILKRKSQDQRREVEEGLKLAKRVDALRETQAQEEASLEKFRTETLKNIHDETTKEQARVEILKKEVRDFEKRKQEAQKPLDQERDRLKREAEQLSHDRDQLFARANDLDMDARKLDRRDKELASQNRVLSAERAKSATLIESVREKERQAINSLTKAETLHAEAIRYREENETELGTRYELVEKREHIVIARLQEFEEKKKSLDEREIKLLDREQTLARNLDRLKKYERKRK